MAQDFSCVIAAIIVLLQGQQFLPYYIMIVPGNSLHMSCDNIYMMQTRLQHSVSPTFTSKGKSLCIFRFVCMFLSQCYYVLINQARGPYEEIFVLTFKVYVP